MRFVGERVRAATAAGWLLGTVHTVGPGGARLRVWIDEPGHAGHLVRPRDHPWWVEGVGDVPALPPGSSTQESKGE